MHALTMSLCVLLALAACATETLNPEASPIRISVKEPPKKTCDYIAEIPGTGPGGDIEYKVDPKMGRETIIKIKNRAFKIQANYVYLIPNNIQSSPNKHSPSLGPRYGAAAYHCLPPGAFRY